MNKIHAIC